MSFPQNFMRLAAIPFCVVLHMVAHGQVTWRRTYGGTGVSEARCVRQTADGGYIIAGSTGSFGNGSSDIYVLHVDALGVPDWSRVYGGLGVDYGVACRELPDGYIIAGTTALGSNGSYDMLLIRTDMQGEPIWERNYGTSAWDLCNSLDVRPDGYVIGGVSFGGGMTNGAAFVVRTDLNGDTLWTKKFGGLGRMECNGLTHTADYGIVMVGSMGMGQAAEDGFLSKLDSDGNQLWVTPIVGDSMDILRSVVEKTNGDLVACGITSSHANVTQIYLACVNSAGQFQWSQYIGNTADAGGAEIRQRRDGGLVFTGFNTLNLGEKDMILTTTDASGYFQFGNNYGDGRPAEGFSIDTTSDGGYVVAGWAEGYGPGQRAMYVVKTDSAGQTQDLNVVPYNDPLPVEEMTRRVNTNISPSLLFAGGDMYITLLPAGSAIARISDMRGSLVVIVSIPAGGKRVIQIPDIAPGPYIISIAQEGQLPLVSKFVVVN